MNLGFDGLVAPFRLNRRFATASTAFSVLWAFSLVLGWNLTHTGTCRIGSWSTWLIAIVMAFVFSVSCYLILTFFESRRLVYPCASFMMSIKHPLIFSWLFICMAWLPIVIARWPGDFSFDAMWQTAYILPNKSDISEYWSHLNAWHPPLHSLWLGGMLVLGQAFFQSYGAGLAMYTVSQVLLFSLCIAGMVSYAYKSGHSVIFIMSLLFASLFPGFSVYATMTTKDVLFSGLLALSVLWTYRTMIGDFPYTSRFWVLQGFSLYLLSILMRNNAFYAYFAFAVIVLLFTCLHRLDARRVLIALIPAVVCSLIITGPGYRAVGIEPGPSKEFMSVPSVQLSSVLVDHGSELDAADRDYLERLIPDWQQYQRNTLADQTKARFNVDLVGEDPIHFLGIYIKLAIRYPGNFFDAWALLSAGYWAPSIGYADDTSAVQLPLMCPYDAVRGTLPEYLEIPFEEPVPALSKALDSFCATHPEVHVPIIGVLFKASTWLWLAMAYVFASIALGITGKKVMPIVILLVYCLTLMFGPGSIYRYASPLFTCAPLLLILFSELVGLSRRSHVDSGM